MPGEWIEWAAAERPMRGEVVSGDGWFVHLGQDAALFAGVDGLGHGEPAAEATRVALAVVRDDPWASLETLVERCHRKTAGTRGVALTLVRIGVAGDVQWLGVGNVECLLMRLREGSREAAPLRGGAVGFRLPPLRVNSVTATPGDLLVLATDGVAGAFADRMPRVGPVRRLADDILARHGKEHDDVLVVVARYMGARG